MIRTFLLPGILIVCNDIFNLVSICFIFVLCLNLIFNLFQSSGDLLLSVNKMSLKGMSHNDAVSLITRQPKTVELELVETSGNIPYHLTTDGSDSGSDSNKSIGGSQACFCFLDHHIELFATALNSTISIIISLQLSVHCADCNVGTFLMNHGRTDICTQ